jgi:hypothetical protein
MGRRNQGPRLRWHRTGTAYFICWTEGSRSRECSTYTQDRQEAEIIFAEWLQTRQQKVGPSDPDKILITDILTSYIAKQGPKVIGQETMGRCVENLARAWEGKTVAEITSDTIASYNKKRGVSAGTLRRELGVLQAAINHGHRDTVS